LGSPPIQWTPLNPEELDRAQECFVKNFSLDDNGKLITQIGLPNPVLIPFRHYSYQPFDWFPWKSEDDMKDGTDQGLGHDS